MHVLVAGWFSFNYMGTTAGDLIARDIVSNWLKEASISYDIAIADPFMMPGGVYWNKVDPLNYTDIIFVCGPFGNGSPITEFLAFFSNCRLIGVNLSLLDSLENWNPFTHLYERDSSIASHPDITFYAPSPTVPVAGVILAHKQKEYANKAMHDHANNAIDRLISSRELSIVPIDTSLENNAGGLRTAGEVEALIARMNLVITTRLHGTVLALKNGIPVIPIDPIAGGAKITLQVQRIGWPLLFHVDSLNDEALSEAFQYCLTKEARMKARDCSARAINEVRKIHQKFVADMKALSFLSSSDRKVPRAISVHQGDSSLFKE
jgi:hypothetical protein